MKERFLKVGKRKFMVKPEGTKLKMISQSGKEVPLCDLLKKKSDFITKEEFFDSI